MREPRIAGLADDHVHSKAGSADAQSTVLELCRCAVERQLCRICFTEHLDFDEELPEFGYYVFENAFTAVEEARAQFADQLEIRMGVEVDFESRFADTIPPVLERLPVDYVLGAVHVYQGRHFIAYRNDGQTVVTAEELAALYRSHFADVRALIRMGLVDCLAHFDYPAKVGFRTVDGMPAPGYEDEIEETLTLAVQYGVGLEINTKHARRGAALAAPEHAVQRYLALGGTVVTLGSDAHRIEHLGGDLDLGADVLHRAGVICQTVFRNRRAERIPLGGEQ